MDGGLGRGENLSGKRRKDTTCLGSLLYHKNAGLVGSLRVARGRINVAGNSRLPLQGWSTEDPLHLLANY